MTAHLEPFALSLGERNSALWVRLHRHLTERLAIARAKNDNAALDAAQTAALRGQIAILKALVALNEGAPLPE